MNAAERPLGPSEELIWRMVEAGSIHFATVARVEPGIPPDLLARALASLQRRHPLLAARVEPGPVPRFVVPDFPASIPVERHEAATWTSVAESRLNAPLDWAREPLVRSDVLADPAGDTLVLTFHHAIGDARSGTILVRDLLAECARGVDRPLPASPIPPPLDERLPPASRRLLPALGYAARRTLARLRFPARPAREASLDPLETRIESRVLEAGPLRGACRGEGTTVQGALAAAMLLALAEDVGRPATLGCLTPIDVRARLVPPVGDELGFYVSGVPTHHRVGRETRYWDLAREIRGRLERAGSRGDPLVSAAMSRLVLARTRDPAALVREVIRFLGVATTVTNLGLLDVPETYGPWSLEALHFAVAGNGFPGTAIGIAVTTFRGRMTVNALYGVPWLSPERALRIIDRAHRFLVDSALKA